MSFSFVNNWFNAWSVADGFVTTAPANHSLMVPVSNVTAGHWLIACVAWHAVPEIEATVSVGDDATNYWIPLATSYSSSASFSINPNWAFSSGASNWTIQGASYTSSTAIMYGTNSKSLQLTPTSGSSAVNIASTYEAITASDFYTATLYVYSPTGYQSVQAGIAYENSSHVYIGSILGPATYVPPNTWTTITVSGQVPTTAVYGAVQFLALNHPQPWNIMYLGQGVLNAGQGYSADTRVAIWAAPNVSVPTNVFVAPLNQVTALACEIFEFAGLPTWLHRDAIGNTFINGSSNVTVTVNPTQADLIVAAGANNNISYQMNRVRSGWSAYHYTFDSNGVDTVGDIYLLGTWTQGSTPTSAKFYGVLPINSNPLFVTNLAGWQASNSTIALSSTPTLTSSTTHNMKITPNGTSATVGALMGNTSAPSVTAGQTYLGEAYIHAPFATGSFSVTVSMTWLTSGHATISSITSSPTTVVGATSTAAITFYNAIVQGIAPATAAFASLHVNALGHLAASKTFNVLRGSVTKTENNNVGIAAVSVGFQLTPTSPTQPTSTWPRLSLEVGFGQASGTPPDQIVWTDISDRLYGVSLDRGRQYELNALEAAEANFVLRNDDGKLTPGSSAVGAYNVQVYNPVRVTALWQGKVYGIYRGFMERWPQTWIDAHYGLVPAIGVDAWAMYVTELRSIVQNEFLLDAPFGYWPLGDAKGNSSAVNLGISHGQYPLKSTPSLIGVAASATVSFGSNAMPLVGDSGTCWEVKGLTSSQSNNGWNLQYGGPFLPPLIVNPTIVWRAFPEYTGPAPVPGNRLAIMTMVGASNQPMLSVWMDDGTGIHVTTWNGATGAQTDHTPSSSFGYSFNAQYFLNMTPSTFTLYLGGSDTLTGTESFEQNWANVTFNGRIDNFNHGQYGNLAVTEIAIFDRPVDYSRFVTYNFSAVNGMANDAGDWRVSRFLSYINWSTPAKIYTDNSDQRMSGATDIAGQDVATAINNIAQTEAAFNWVDRNGYVTYRTRSHVLDRPVQATFGENTAAGEIPYLVTVELDYDPQYIQNDIQITHLGTPAFSSTGEASSASSSVQINITNQSSITQFSDRSLQLTSYFNTVAQSINLANWLLNQYSYPHMRVAQVEITPGSNPTTFTKLLNLEIGDRVILNRRPIGANNVISLNVMIIGIHHDIEWKSGKWVMKFDLMPQQIAALQTVSLTLDDPVLGKLDSGNVIGW